MDSPRYARAIYIEAVSALTTTTTSREQLELWINALREANRFQMLSDEHGRAFMFWSDFCTAREPFGLGYSPAALEELVKSKPTAAELALEAVPIGPVRHAGSGRGNKTDVDNNGLSGSTNADYLTARIARDRPDVLERMKAGEYGSVRAAAKDAGLVRERWSVPAEPRAAAVYLKRKLSAAQLAALIEELGM